MNASLRHDLRILALAALLTGAAKGTLHLQTTGGITEESAYCVRLDIESAGDGKFGIANEGFSAAGATRSTPSNSIKRRSVQRSPAGSNVSAGMT